MHSLEAKNGTVFNFNPDMSGKVRVMADDFREVWIEGADLIEFMRHVDSLKPRSDVVRNGDTEFRIYSQHAEMSSGGVSGWVEIGLENGQEFDPAKPTSIGANRIKLTVLTKPIRHAGSPRHYTIDYMIDFTAAPVTAAAAG